MLTRSPCVIATIDSHTAGHPTRVIIGGLPPLPGGSVADRRTYFARHHDELRTFLLHEPRGHAAMVGAVLCESAQADFGAFFLGSYGYLDMCGHATMGVAVTLGAMGQIRPNADGLAAFALEVPAGIVRVGARYERGRIVGVYFDNLPAFLAARDVVVSLPGAAPIPVDIAYGGNWYGLVDARAAGLDLGPETTQAAMALGARIKGYLNRRIVAGTIDGATSPLDSVLFWEDDTDDDGTPVSRQLVVLASNKFDRSPCGTGTSARLAQMLARGRLEPGRTVRARNILGVDFAASARLIPEAPGAVQPRVEGAAHITGYHTFLRDPEDPLPVGFLCR